MDTNTLLRPLILAFSVLTAGAFLLSCNQDETAFGPQDLKAFESSVTGRVTDRSGKALSGALVTALPGGRTTVTGPDGSFTLSGLPTGSYRIAVAKDDYRDTMWLDSARLGLSVANDLGAIGMRFRFATITGLVEDSSGAALPAAGVSVEDQMASAMAVSGGKFLLGRVEPGRVRLFSAIRGIGYGTLDTTIQPDDTLKGVRIRINRQGGTVTGKVVGEDGNAVAGAQVLTMGGALDTVTGGDGTFRITEVPSEGNVVVTIVNGNQSTLLMGVRVGEGGTTNLARIELGEGDPGGSVKVRKGMAMAYSTDSVVSVVADVMSGDTTFHVLRYLWSPDGGGTWDTTSVNMWEVAVRRLPGSSPSVLVRVLAMDGRSSEAGTITVRIMPPPDKTPPTVARVGSTTTDTTLPATSTRWTASWTVSDNLLDSVWINGEPVVPSDGSYSFSDTLKEGVNLFALKAIDSAGNVNVDTIRVTRSPIDTGGAVEDTLAPETQRIAPGKDTLSSDTVTVSWSVTDDVGVDTVWIEDGIVALNGGMASKAIALEAGSTTVHLRAVDKAGNEKLDSMTLWRLQVVPPDTIKDTTLRSLVVSVGNLIPGFDRETRVYYDTIPAADTAVTITAIASDSTFASVSIDNGPSPRTIRVGQPGTPTPVQIVVKGSDGGEIVYTLKIWRALAASSGGVDSAPPTFELHQPTVSDTTFSSRTDSVLVRWKVQDDRMLGTVTIGGTSATPDGDGFVERMIALADSTVEVVLDVSDTAGHHVLDTLRLTRWTRLNLKNIQVQPGGIAFHPDTMRYSVVVDSSSAGLMVMCTLNDTDASLAIDGWTLQSMLKDRYVSLVAGDTTHIRVVVANHGDSVVYTIDAYRKPIIDSTFGVRWNDSVAYGVLTDARDQKSYRTVTINGKRWMAENLDFDTAGSWPAGNDADTASKYGRLYTWSAAMGLPPSCDTMVCAMRTDTVFQGACPTGWHVPNTGDWDILLTGMGNSTGTLLKSSAGWPQRGNGTDSIGFRVLPAGVRHPSGIFDSFGSVTDIWTANGASATPTDASNLMFGPTASNAEFTSTSKSYGFSLRCKED